MGYLKKGVAIASMLGWKKTLAIGAGTYLLANSHLTDRNVIDVTGRTIRGVLNFNDEESVASQLGRTVVDNTMGDGEYDKTVNDVKGWFSGSGGSDGEVAEQSAGGVGQGKSLLGGLMSGITGGLKNMMSGLFGGVTNMFSNKSLPLVMLLPALWLMFGRFGWMGKIGGLLLGAFAASSLLDNGQHQQVSRQVAVRQGGGTAQERYDEAMKSQQQVDEEDRYTVKR